MWRYRELLPVGDGPVRYPVPVGGTPLLPAPALRQRLGAPRLWIKDETRNPTASNKDRATALVIEDGLRRGSPPDLGRVVVDVQAGPRELRPAVVPAAARAGPVDHHSGRRPPGERGRHQAQQRRRHRVLRPMARVPQPGATARSPSLRISACQGRIQAVLAHHTSHVPGSMDHHDGCATLAASLPCCPAGLESRYDRRDQPKTEA